MLNALYLLAVVLTLCIFAIVAEYRLSLTDAENGDLQPVFSKEWPC
jgi:hypothetical protein